MPRIKDARLLNEPFCPGSAERIEWASGALVEWGDSFQTRRDRPRISVSELTGDCFVVVFTQIFDELANKIRAEQRDAISAWVVEDPHPETAEDDDLSPVSWPSEVARFCRDYNVQPALRSACRLAKDCFPSATITGIHRQEDPETGQEWVQVRLTTSATIEEAGKAYNRYTSKWVGATDSYARKLIRLSFKLA